MRIGVVVKVIAEKKIGFIKSDDLHEDVFFHFTKVEKVGTADLAEGDEVEFEVDELSWLEKERLQATLVRRSARPLELRLKPSDAPHLKASHHPRARKARPTWRGGSGSRTPRGDENQDNSGES
ncbi:MAG: cold shock domain-containing protein [Aureliella sp.]